MTKATTRPVTGVRARRGRLLSAWMNGTAIQALAEPLPERERLTIVWERHNAKQWRGLVRGHQICDLIRHEDKWLVRDGGGRTLAGTVKEAQTVAQHRFDKRQEGYGDE